jgi:aquaporin Z
MFGRRKIAALVAEFLGTGILTLLVLSVQRSTIGVPFFVAIAAGLTIIVLSFALGEVSGAQFNPALTLGLWTANRIRTSKAFLYIAVQLLGAWLGYWLYTYYANSTLMYIGGHFTWRVAVAEGVGTAIFAFGYSAVMYQNFSHAVRSSLAGISYIVGVVAASAAAVGLINPALALGVRAWVWGSYVAGAAVGGIVGVQLYNLFFAPALAVAEVAVVAAPKVAPAIVVAKPRTSRTTTTATARKSSVKKPAAKRKPRTAK